MAIFWGHHLLRFRDGGTRILPSCLRHVHWKRMNWLVLFVTQRCHLHLRWLMCERTTMRWVQAWYMQSHWWVYRINQLLRPSQGGHVRGSYNWSAQSFYDDLPSFHQKFKNVPKVIFYCQSSNGRGPRCAGWFVFIDISLTYLNKYNHEFSRYQDYLDAHDNNKSTALVLEGGIKQWLADFKGEEDLVDFDWLIDLNNIMSSIKSADKMPCIEYKISPKPSRNCI